MEPADWKLHSPTRHTGPDERSWRLVPAEPWQAGPYELVVDGILEDLAGNSLTRVFDRDRTSPAEAGEEKPRFSTTYLPR